jgi:hypothetical protein
MSYSIPWNESYPSGNDLLSGVDTYIQQDKIAVRERMESLLGISDWATRDPISADLLKAINIDMSGTADAGIIGGSSSLSLYTNYPTDATAALTVTGTGASKLLTINANMQLEGYINRGYYKDFSQYDFKDLGSKSSNFTVDWADGPVAAVKLTGSPITITLTLKNSPTFLYVKQDITGSRTYAFQSMLWPADTLPTHATLALRADFYMFVRLSQEGLGQSLGVQLAGNMFTPKP